MNHKSLKIKNRLTKTKNNGIMRTTRLAAFHKSHKYHTKTKSSDQNGNFKKQLEI